MPTIRARIRSRIAGALLDERRGGLLHRCGHREIGVADDLEARKRLRHEVRRTAGRHPPQLHLRKAGALRQPAEAEGERLRRLAAALRREDADGPAGRIQADGVIGEHLVAYQCEAMRRRQPAERVDLFRGQERTRGVVRADGEDGAGPRREGVADRFQVDRPRAVVLEAIRARHDCVEPRQVIEERVARARYEHLVSGVAQQLEQERIGLARARGQDDAAGIHRQPPAAEVGGDRVARGREAGGLGFVEETVGRGESRQQRAPGTGGRRGSGWFR